MSGLLSRTKGYLLKYLPEGVLNYAKEAHYARVVTRCAAADEPDLEFVRHLVSAGDHVVDLGANIGTYTKFLSQWVGASGAVYSVEPLPSTFRFLESNVRKLGLRNVELFNCAVSDAPGSVTMEVPPYEAGGDNFYMAHIVSGAERERGVDPSGHTHRVRCETVDSLVADRQGQFSFVKCDVEGHELECLRGATELLAAHRPAWLIEVSGDPDVRDSRAAELFSLLANSGYRAYRYDGSRLRPRKPGDVSINYFFLAQAHLDRLRAGGLLDAD